MSRLMGYFGEKVALAYLISHGYKLIAKNVYYKGGELDLVLLHDSDMVVVEVKNRTMGIYDDIKYSISDSKVKRLIKGCEMFYSDYSKNDPFVSRWRLDAIFIEISQGRRYLQHYQDLLVP